MQQLQARNEKLIDKLSLLCVEITSNWRSLCRFRGKTKNLSESCIAWNNIYLTVHFKKFLALTTFLHSLSLMNLQNFYCQFQVYRHWLYLLPSDANILSRLQAIVCARLISIDVCHIRIRSITHCRIYRVQFPSNSNALATTNAFQSRFHAGSFFSTQFANL